MYIDVSTFDKACANEDTDIEALKEKALEI